MISYDESDHGDAEETATSMMRMIKLFHLLATTMENNMSFKILINPNNYITGIFTLQRLISLFLLISQLSKFWKDLIQST